MPARSSKDDYFGNAARKVVERAKGEKPSGTALESPDEYKNPHAVALGRLGGQKGGRARAERLSSRKRSEIAKKAARARWRKEY